MLLTAESQSDIGIDDVCNTDDGHTRSIRCATVETVARVLSD